MKPRTYCQSVEAFVKASPWLGPVHEPALMMLRSIAHSLDHGESTPALIGQFGLAYRSLLKEAPKADVEADELEQLLP